MTNWISDWLGSTYEPPVQIFAPRASNKSVKKANSQYVYISSISPMSAGSLMEDRIYWGESIIYCEDIKNCELIYEKVQDNLYQLIKDLREKIPTKDRQTCLSLINDYRKKIMMRPLNDIDWSDNDLNIECRRLNLI